MKWKNTANFTGRIYNIIEDMVFVDCLINEQNLIFEKRKFTKNLFSCLPDLKIGVFLIVRMYQRPGELRIRITKGEDGIIPNKTPFEVDLFKDLDNIFKLNE